jgi:hypothetical protein
MNSRNRKNLSKKHHTSSKNPMHDDVFYNANKEKMISLVEHYVYEELRKIRINIHMMNFQTEINLHNFLYNKISQDIQHKYMLSQENINHLMLQTDILKLLRVHIKRILHNIGLLRPFTPDGNLFYNNFPYVGFIEIHVQTHNLMIFVEYDFYKLNIENIMDIIIKKYDYVIFRMKKVCSNCNRVFLEIDEDFKLISDVVPEIQDDILHVFKPKYTLVEPERLLAYYIKNLCSALRQFNWFKTNQDLFTNTIKL